MYSLVSSSHVVFDAIFLESMAMLVDKMRTDGPYSSIELTMLTGWTNTPFQFGYGPLTLIARRRPSDKREELKQEVLLE